MLLGGIQLISLCCWGYTADVFVLLGAGNILLMCLRSGGGGYIADVFVLLRGRVQC